MTTPTSDLQAAIASTLWYHTIELAPGIVTPGWFDLRPVVDALPWPDVRGKRCLDVGTYDGFLAFELERRGAAEVVAVDLDDHSEWDWPARQRATGAESLAALAGDEKGVGFRIAADALGSSVRRVGGSVYRLSELGIGRFDVVVCGSLMLHLRDPIAALESIRNVCDGEFLSSESVDLRLSLLHPKRPYARLDGTSALCQWWSPNTAGHRQMVESGGFDIVRHAGGSTPTRSVQGTQLRAAIPAPGRSVRYVALASATMGCPTLPSWPVPLSDPSTPLGIDEPAQRRGDR